MNQPGEEQNSDNDDQLDPRLRQIALLVDEAIHEVDLDALLIQHADMYEYPVDPRTPAKTLYDFPPSAPRLFLHIPALTASRAANHCHGSGHEHTQRSDG